ncbi:MAG TPA: DUF6544 family protein [Acidimicrobiia bacterium]|nr:DUF6544 family protein [Acidimicrobiia bacterium]
MYQRFIHTLAAAQIEATTPNPTPVTDTDLLDLPPTVRRYLRFMGVVGRPRDRSFRAQFSGRFRLAPDKGWMPCEAWQYNTGPPPTRVFFMRARFGHLIPMVARDTYAHGHGRMLGKLFDLITVVDGTGDEFDTGELVTYLNDAVLLAPSLLLGPNVTWQAVDDSTFGVTLTDAGRTVTGHIFIDEHGAPRDFSTTDRFAALPQVLVRAQWRTPIKTWTTSNGRPLPCASSAIWQLPEGPFAYIEGRFVPGQVTYNMLPDGTPEPISTPTDQ